MAVWLRETNRHQVSEKMVWSGLLKLSSTHYFHVFHAQTRGFVVSIDVAAALGKVNKKLKRFCMHYLIEIRKSPTIAHLVHQEAHICESARL